MKHAQLLLVGLLVAGGASVVLALPPGGVASLLDLTAERLAAPPELRLETPADGDGVGAIVRIAGTATSDAREVIDVQIRIDDERWESLLLATRGQRVVAFEADVPLAPGDHLLEARAWDGEAFSLPARALVRRDAPTLLVAQPADRASVPPGAIRFSGTVAGDAEAVVLAAGQLRAEAPVLPGGAWSATLALHEGVHEVRLHARADVPSLVRTLRLAVGGPSLSVLTPEDASSYGEAGDLACGGGCILFTGASERATAVRVSVDGHARATLAPGAGGAWSFRLPVLGLANGTHHARFTPVDAEGEAGVPAELTFLARTPRTLRIEGETDPRPSGTPLRFVLHGEHASTATWTLDGAVVGEGPSVSFALARPGDHHLTARTQPPTGTAESLTVALHALNRPPSVRLVAEATARGPLTLLQAHAQDADGEVVEHRWAFEDGTRVTTAAPEVLHRFAARGLQRVDLSVVDDRGALARDTQLLLVPNAPAVADLRWSPDEPTVLDVVELVDASHDPDGRIASRTWTLPDGRRVEASNLSVRFDAPGAHAIELTVVDDHGEATVAAREIVVRNLPPTASFAHEPGLPQADGDVTFLDLSADPEARLARWRWDLGDGNVSDRSSLVHRYAAPGEYVVRLEVTDHLGLASAAERLVRVADSAPVVDLVVHEPREPTTQQDVSFRAVARDREGGIDAFLWDFGDGNTSGEVAPRHRYARSGLYEGNLTVTDGGGLSVSLPFLLRVRNVAPTAELRLLDGGYAAFPSLLLLEARDADGRPALYRFDADGDGTLDCETTLPRCAFTYPTAGAYGARAWVEDDEGALAEAQLAVEMLAPPSHLAPPRVTIAAPTHGATLRGDVLLRGEASGVRPIAKVELQLQQGAWAFSGARDAWRLANGASPWTSLLDTRAFPDGAYELVARATDARGGIGETRTPITIANGPRAPEVSVRLHDVPALLLEDTTLRGSAYHPLGVSMVRWRVDEGAWRFIGGPPLSFGITLAPAQLGPGEHVLQVEAWRGTAERAATNVTFRVPGVAPALVVDEPPPPVAHGMIRATGRIAGVGHAQWRLDHDVWRDLPPGDWVLAEETMRLRGGPHVLHLRAVGPEGLASNATSYELRVVNPPAPDVYLRPSPPAQTRDAPGPGAAILLAGLALLALARRRP